MTTTKAYKFFDLPTVTLDIQRPDPALVKRAAAFGTATLHEAGGKIGALPSAIKPMDPSFTIAGPAFTVHSPPGDNLWLHRAIAIAKPGDVLVVFTEGVYEHGYWGEIMSTAAKAAQLGGLVIDGCVRDGALLGKVGFPVFARGLCIRGTGKDFAARGWINAPLLLGDITVEAGDLIVGDTDGVCAVPRARAEEVVRKSQEREDKEAETMRQLRAGEKSIDLYGWDK
ncbi:MAG: 4-carboxy-4-hydroxy-2-oxoadipate aldolase/oxaloacetate decarboxylase [Candidatus Lustribacter sp.]